MPPPSPAATARSIHETTMESTITGMFPPNRNDRSQSFHTTATTDNKQQQHRRRQKHPHRKQRHGKHNIKTKTTTKQQQQQRRHYLKFHSSSCEVGSDFHRRSQTVFDKIDPSVGAQKLCQRQKQIEKGKNTVGYDEYRRRVPFDQRIPRNMDTPSTPDHSLDIPNRQWNGMVRAWRIALHKYDPKDLQEAFQEAQSAKLQYGEITGGSNNEREDYGDLNDFGNEGIDRVDDDNNQRELAEAQKQGLLDLVVVDTGKRKNTGSSEGYQSTPSSTSRVAAAGSSSFYAATTASGVVKITPSSSSSLLLSSRPVATGAGGRETQQHVNKEEGFFDDDGNSFMSEGDMSDDDDDLL